MIEKLLERIAVALETLVAIIQTDEGAPAKKPAKAAAAVDEIPGQESAGGPGNETMLGEEESGIKTAADLRDLAQKYIQAAGDSTGTLVTFIQSVAKLFNAKEPKLIKIPVGKVAEAAKMIENWCAKKGIKLPIEV